MVSADDAMERRHPRSPEMVEADVRSDIAALTQHLQALCRDRNVSFQPCPACAAVAVRAGDSDD